MIADTLNVDNQINTKHKSNKIYWPDFKFPPINLWSVWRRFNNDGDVFNSKTYKLGDNNEIFRKQ